MSLLAVKRADSVIHHVMFCYIEIVTKNSHLLCWFEMCSKIFRLIAAVYFIQNRCFSSSIGINLSFEQINQSYVRGDKPQKKNLMDFHLNFDVYVEVPGQ